MSTVAQNIIIPKESGLFRIIFLYVGQGDATLLVAPDGDSYQYILIDTNIDKKNEGIDIAYLLEDLLDTDSLDVFVNTHPHVDHLAGIKEIHERVGIKEIWHSGHKPGKKHNDAYMDMQGVIKKIGKENEYVLMGTNDINKIRENDKETEKINKIGDIDYQVLSPAEYVCDEIENDEAEKRYQRIHEQCAVMKISYGSENKGHILFTGDSDRAAWENNITKYHKDNLKAQILSASHHGSRTFFKSSEEDDSPFEDHIQNIEPEYVIISAPKQSESKHDHPHDDALDIYSKYVDAEDIFHLGKNRECIIIDITTSGDYSLKSDKELHKKYKFQNNDDNNNEDEKKYENIGIATSQLDDKPMGN